MSTKIVGSNAPEFASDALAMPGKSFERGYGQNGYGGASSDNPGNRTASGYLPDMGKPINDQLGKVKPGNVPTAFGIKDPNKR